MGIESHREEDVATASQATHFAREVHGLVGDLWLPDPAIYWTDFLVTMGVAYAAFFIYMSASRASWQIPALLICGLALYRAVIFTHEIAHRPPGLFSAFRIVWNLFCGVPVLLPSFLYGDHSKHHSKKFYGTAGDAEYLFLSKGCSRAWLFLLLSFVYPLLAPLRFLLFTPLAMAVPAFDRVVWRYGSSLYMMNPDYRREYNSAARSAERWIAEIACCLWAWTIVGLVWAGVVSWPSIAKVYILFFFWMALNQLRTLVAHRYAHDGSPGSHLEQTLDSNTFPKGGWMPDLWAPLGLRYHALHHLLPSLPYHSMAKAHRRILEHLPPGSAYHQTLQSGFGGALVDSLFRRRAAVELEADSLGRRA